MNKYTDHRKKMLERVAWNLETFSWYWYMNFVSKYTEYDTQKWRNKVIEI